MWAGTCLGARVMRASHEGSQGLSAIPREGSGQARGAAGAAGQVSGDGSGPRSS